MAYGIPIFDFIKNNKNTKVIMHITIFDDALVKYFMHSGINTTIKGKKYKYSLRAGINRKKVLYNTTPNSTILSMAVILESTFLEAKSQIIVSVKTI